MGIRSTICLIPVHTMVIILNECFVVGGKKKVFLGAWWNGRMPIRL